MPVSRLYPSTGRTRKNTAEQRDAEQLAKLREQAQKTKEASQKSFQQIKRGMSPVKNIRSKPATRPKGINLKMLLMNFENKVSREPLV